MPEKLSVRVSPETHVELLSSEKIIRELLKDDLVNELPDKVTCLIDYSVELAKGQEIARQIPFTQRKDLLPQAKAISRCYKKAIAFGVTTGQLEMARSFAVMVDVYVEGVNQSKLKKVVPEHTHRPLKFNSL